MEELKLHDAVVFLAAAGLLIPIAKRYRISSVLGFLLIGLAVGPHGFARFAQDYPWLQYLLITDVDGVNALAELGVVFLLFMIGLELSLEKLWEMRRLVIGMGFSQIGITGLMIGMIAWWFGNSIAASVLLGSCLALSSTAIVMQLLIEQGRFGSVVGHGSFSILLAQDIAVIPILFAVGTIGGHLGGSILWGLGLAIGEAIIAIILILGVGRLLIRPLFKFVQSAQSPELFMAVTLLIIIATAGATHAAGMSAALGAFLAGLLLAECEYRHEIEVNIEPFKGLLLGLFFMSIAMGIDLAELFNNFGWILASVVGLFVIKSSVITGLSRLFGFGWGQSVEIGLLLGQGGEFGFMVIGMALGFGLIPDGTAQFMLIVVGATMFLTPLIARLGRTIGTTIRSREQSPESLVFEIEPDLTGHVIIVGFGRTGKLLATVLDQQLITHVSLDLDVSRVSQLQAEGLPIYLGDASRSAMLSKMRLAHADALVVCIDDPGATEQVLVAARNFAPHVPIVVRARDSFHANKLLELGATRVVLEVLESGLQMGQVLLEEVGLPVDVVRSLIDVQRRHSQHTVLPKSVQGSNQ